jgi:hypothetical protein
MYQKLNQNRYLKVALCCLAVFMLIGFTLALPYEEVAAQGLGSNFGGRIIVSIPTGYWWGISYCLPHVMIVSFGAPYRGPLALMLPPGNPKQYYNYFTPGVAVMGKYFPTPIIGSCPYPLFPTTMMGTSATPGL